MIIAAIVLMIAALVLLSLFVKKIKDYQRQHDKAEAEAERYLSKNGMQSFVDEGYLFCGLFHVDHIYACGLEVGKTLFRLDVLRIAAQIKHDFDPERGITNQVIREAVLAYSAKLSRASQKGEEFNINDHIDL